MSAWQAWHTAALPLTKKFPKLSDMLGDNKVEQAQSPDEMIAAMQAWVGVPRH